MRHRAFWRSHLRCTAAHRSSYTRAGTLWYGLSHTIRLRNPSSLTGKMPISGSASPSPAAGAATPDASANIDVATAPTTSTATAAGADGVTANTPPTFSTLPMGPLATAALFLTEADVAQLLRTDKEMATLNATEVVSDEFWRERCCRTFGDHADVIEPLGKDAFRAFLRAKQHVSGKDKWELPPLLPGGARFDRLRLTDQLLDRCSGASSQDRDDEDPANTLSPSRCAIRMESAKLARGKQSQTECGCVFFRKCYWSSEPSPVADKDEWIDYGMAEGMAVVTSFVLTPYTSFWQPQAPTYNPVEAYFQLSHPRVNGGEQPYYESPYFRVEDVMKRQQFELPRPILSLGGTARVVLSGMAQRQTLPAHAGETANHYHICMSYVALMGAVVLSCSLADGPADSPAAKSSSDDYDGTAIEPNAVGNIAGQRSSAGGKGGDVQSAIAELTGREDSANTIAGPVRKQTQGVLRLRWAVFVSVRAVVTISGDRGTGGTSARTEELPYAETCVKIKAFSDTPCAELLELYAQLQVPKLRLEDGRPTLLLEGGPGDGRPLPTDVDSGAVLGDFASEGSLVLVDASNDGMIGGI